MLDLPEWANPLCWRTKPGSRLVARRVRWGPAHQGGGRERVRAGPRLRGPCGPAPHHPRGRRRAVGAVVGWIYTTWSHTPERPRFRLVVLLSRPVTAAEYPCSGAGRRHAAGRGAPYRRGVSRCLAALVPARGEAGAPPRIPPLPPRRAPPIWTWMRRSRSSDPRRRRPLRPQDPQVRRARTAPRYCRRGLDGALEDIRLAPMAPVTTPSG